jgi:hypothetical protein
MCGLKAGEMKCKRKVRRNNEREMGVGEIERIEVERH